MKTLLAIILLALFALIFSGCQTPLPLRITHTLKDGTRLSTDGHTLTASHGTAGIRGSYPNSFDADLFSPTFSATAQNVWFFVQGILKVTSSGAFAWNWAQSSSSANSITLLKGSFITVSKID